MFFDLDGTLTDSAPGITRCLRHGVLSVGGGEPELADLTRFIGTPLVEIYRALLPGAGDERVASAIKAYIERFNRLGIRENSLYPGIRDLLEELRASGHLLYVATAKLAETGRQVVELFELADRFEAVHGGPGGPQPVEKHEILAAALASHDVAANDAIMIGDRHHDIRAAQTLGTASIGVTWGYGGADELAGEGASAIVDEPSQVSAVIADLVLR